MSRSVKVFAERHGRLGKLGFVGERHGELCNGLAGEERLALDGNGMVRQVRRGMKRIGKQVRGVAWQARYGLKKEVNT